MSRYIDAEELKDFVFRYGGNATVDDCIKWIEQTETADVRENVKGEWKCNIEWGYGTCSVCGRTFPIRNGNTKADRYNFCPNCGADMRGGNNA